MKEVMMDMYVIVGENAEAAADYIDAQESRMISAGAGNAYFEQDYAENINRFKAEAAKLYGVTYRYIWEEAANG